MKAYYRMGLAYLARDEFDLAKDALVSAHEIEPKNSEVAAALKQLKKNMEDYKWRTSHLGARGWGHSLLA